MFTAAQLRQWDEQGYVALGQVATDAELEALQRRIDDIMLGKVRYPGMFFQLDSETGEYEDVPPGSNAWQGPTLAYRKIQDLEQDDLFLAYLQHPRFRGITRQLIGPDVAVFRAMFMNKPAERGTHLPYHQDAGSQWQLSQDPILTIWTALDPATRANGCVQVIPGRHKLGLLSERGHTITPGQERRYCPEEKSVYLEARPGEVYALHNLLLHRSVINTTGTPRRAFSVCYMDAATRHVGPGERRYPVVFGRGALGNG